MKVNAAYLSVVCNDAAMRWRAIAGKPGLQFIELPTDGCRWDEVERLTPAQFLDACGAKKKPCALGWAYEWRTYDAPVGEGKAVSVTAPVGVVYDFRAGCWRQVGPA